MSRVLLMTLTAAVALTTLPTACVAEVDARRSFGYLKQICAIGRRVSGTDGMNKQQQLLTRHFAQHKGQVFRQEFDARHPLTGEPVRMTNLIVVWRPEAKRRILLACHYDTRPFPDRDFRNPKGLFVGANDGGSGVAVMMELAHHMKDVPPGIGIDFVLFDGEELVFNERGDYFVGSEYFAKAYQANPPEYRYEACVLLDMVGDKALSIYKERNSQRYAPDLNTEFWQIARQQGAREFVSRIRHEVRDDHLPLNQIAQIPTVDVIDFDYRYWHTTQDVPDRCSGKSLATVTRVVLAWFAHRSRLAAGR